MRASHRVVLTFVAALILISGAIVVVRHLQHSSRTARWEISLRHLAEMSHTKLLRCSISARYAEIAEREQRHATAIALRAISASEYIQHRNCRQALASYRHTVRAESDSPTINSSTLHNLHALLDHKRRYHHRTTHYIHIAHQTQNRHLARLFTWCDAGETGHIRMLYRILGPHPAPQRYYICPRCSNISDEELLSHLCPLCLTPCGEFIVIE